MKIFATGEIVRWGKSLWIVAESDEDNLMLLSTTCANASAYISKEWPTKKKDRVIKWVASNMFDFIQRSLDEVGKKLK
jgi:hypothetical protein